MPVLMVVVPRRSTLFDVVRVRLRARQSLGLGLLGWPSGAPPGTGGNEGRRHVGRVGRKWLYFHIERVGIPSVDVAVLGLGSHL